jgi:hypothetical protein
MDFLVSNVDQLGKILQGFRRTRHLTQGEAGKKVGLLQKNVSGLETNPGAAQVDRLFRLLMERNPATSLGRDRPPVRPS